MLIALILSIICAFTLYSHAKKIGASQIKWAIIGILTAFIPLVLIPNAVIIITGRPDLGGPAVMLAVIIAFVINAIIKNRMRLPQPKESEA